ncbi:cation-translocating P-type ATPase [Hazenella sp. IB182357]|uniref:P-type Cu(+) transporter n=1 Tax=Polycladospora coralii TaxID=2771432 RepID=A0A926RST1_9BACL|nr:cation-translocating P-type ATPase [Polycladospora coralii]MBD1371850.1 cation-translocating P-type ATPase [Polycladospora coralii]MBS7529311.1 cation-translocating P-type ATPase [Polycladospora coralii]
MKQVQLQIMGMHCAACVQRIEKRIGKIEGVNQIRVNLATGNATIRYFPKQLNLSYIQSRIENLGFKVSTIQSKHRAHHHKDLLRFLLSALLSIPLISVMLTHLHGLENPIPSYWLNPWFQCILTAIIQWGIGWPFYQRAWQALKNKHTTMDTLVALSTLTAFGYSFFLTLFPSATHTPLFYESSAMIITFILFGKWLEAKAMFQAQRNTKQLTDLFGQEAIVIRANQLHKIKVDQIAIGDILLIQPGAKIPIDGIVVFGKSFVDESFLTGESTPVTKAGGDLVYGGSTNQYGQLRIKATHLSQNSTLAQMVQLVERAQTDHAPIQRIADQITAVFVPIIIVIAIVTFFAWYLLLQPEYLYGAIEKAITVLIIACPCALGLATPTSILVGSGKAAQLGILFKEGRFLEALHQVDVILFDKTGTLTSGKPQVSDIYVVNRFQERDFLRCVGATEQSSEHPMAFAILQEISRRKIALPSVSRFQALPGYGVEAYVGSRRILIGSPRLLRKEGITFEPILLKLRELEASGHTVLLVAIQDQIAGLIAVTDEIKPDAISSVHLLKKLGKTVGIVSGDHKKLVQATARMLQIDHYHAEVLPQDKVKIIQKIQSSGKRVAMIGDGINDAPALKTANIGIAMGTGANLTNRACDIQLLHNHLFRVVQAFKISKRTMMNIKQNLLWALGYNAINIPLAVLGLLNPWIGALTMASSSLIVVLNALRLQK